MKINNNDRWILFPKREKYTDLNIKFLKVRVGAILSTFVAQNHVINTHTHKYAGTQAAQRAASLAQIFFMLIWVGY